MNFIKTEDLDRIGKAIIYYYIECDGEYEILKVKQVFEDLEGLKIIVERVSKDYKIISSNIKENK